MKKNFVGILFSLGLALSLTGAVKAENNYDPIKNLDLKKNDIVILYDNDVHCAVDGYKKLKALENDALEKTKNVVLVSSGDFVQGATIGSISQGEAIIDIMNKMGYDVVTIGNHEFDYGMKQTKKLLSKLNADVVSSNFTKIKSNKSVYKTYVIKDFNGTKVAFIGIATPESITKSTPTYFQDKKGSFIYDFKGDGQKLYQTVQKNVNAARKAGAKYVIALAHLGTEGVTPKWSSTNVIKNTSGIDVILDGHSHSTIDMDTVYNKDQEPVLLTSTGSRFQNFGELVISNTGAITSTLVPVEKYAKVDPEIEKYIDGLKNKYNSLLSTIIGKNEVELTTLNPETHQRAIRNAETNLGDFCADAYKDILEGDLSILNGGGIRDNINKGDITLNDVLSVSPFGNMGCLVELKGETIRDALEISARSYPEENGGFLQVSGLKYTIDPNIPSPVKLDSKNMFIKLEGIRRVSNVMVFDKEKKTYVPIDINKKYKVAGINYVLRKCGDGYTIFKGAKVLKDDTILDSDILIKYIQDKLKGVVGKKYENPFGDKRIIIKK